MSLHYTIFIFKLKEVPSYRRQYFLSYLKSHNKLPITSSSTTSRFTTSFSERHPIKPSGLINTAPPFSIPYNLLKISS